MQCKDIIDIIEETYPLHYALEWDNAGLLSGRDDKEVRRIYIALDAQESAIESAIQCKADMLITHHPMIFSPIKRVNNKDFIGRRLLSLIGHDISYYAMHTNYDVLGMAELSARMLGMKDAEVLEVTCKDAVEKGIGRVADLKMPVTLKECCERVKDAFHLDTVKVFGNLNQKVGRAAISPGAGKSMIEPALEKRADVLITGDIDHHTGLDAVSQGMCIIDAGHYGVEHIFIEDMHTFLERRLENVEIVSSPVVHPFEMI